MPVVRVSVATFLNLRNAGNIIDVRSPKEFAHAHIPEAVNLPLFSDAVRAEIGTLYTRVGRDAAITRGFEDLSGRLENYRKALLENTKEGILRIHCWRGGMRSECVAWLAERSGCTVYLLEGGYKSFRNYVLQTFEEQRNIVILAGMTGAGKTEVLQAMLSMGVYMVDLEGLAHHKGSAFGTIGETPQPSTEQFENELALNLRAIPSQEPLWLEDESKNIGKVLIPIPLFNQMLRAPRIQLETDEEKRLDRLYRIYTHCLPEELIECVEKIRKRLGTEKANECIEFIRNGELRSAISCVLSYYDKQYRHGLATHPTPLLTIIPKTTDVHAIARQILDSLH